MCQSIIRHGLLKFEGEGKGVEMLKEQQFFLYLDPIVSSFNYLLCEVLGDSFRVRFALQSGLSQHFETGVKMPDIYRSAHFAP